MMASGRAIDNAVLVVRSRDKTAAVYERLGFTLICAAYLISPSPERDAPFINAMFGGEVATYPGGRRVSCGPSQEVRLVTSEAIAERDHSFPSAGLTSPILAGISVFTTRPYQGDQG
jgi:hypothetical protein